ncbi:unnamed protein product [Caenorhabditis angaria]|uniref:Uncharacterized protein n=1 Tax=Caenorhabditis angaria TaxID=860376 RepID=A0A9P1NAS4_9PELO|nr:unnamed protein product [Caenorhabditis angaria]
MIVCTLVFLNLQICKKIQKDLQLQHSTIRVVNIQREINVKFKGIPASTICKKNDIICNKNSSYSMKNKSISKGTSI